MLNLDKRLSSIKENILVFSFLGTKKKMKKEGRSILNPWFQRKQKSRSNLLSPIKCLSKSSIASGKSANFLLLEKEIKSPIFPIPVFHFNTVNYYSQFVASKSVF